MGKFKEKLKENYNLTPIILFIIFIIGIISIALIA